MKTIPSICTLR